MKNKLGFLEYLCKMYAIKRADISKLLPWIIALVVLVLVIGGLVKLGLFDKFIKALP